ncbi:hypothetical protein [Kitasatospora sp. NPDC127060]|uniref:hypothetical protein n=1 Tax=Kitasatospora sp. NPDC127060 TaxID=3347121 RepID=UPI0036525396
MIVAQPHPAPDPATTRFELARLAADVAQHLGPKWWRGTEDGRPAIWHPDGMVVGFEPALSGFPDTALFLLHLDDGDEYESAAVHVLPADCLTTVSERAAAAVRGFRARHGYYGPAGHFYQRITDTGTGYYQPSLTDAADAGGCTPRTHSNTKEEPWPS